MEPPEVALTPPSKLAAEVDPLANTGVGVFEVVVELLPSWPLELYPQQSTKPVARTTQTCEEPAESAETPDNGDELEVEPTPKTTTGVFANVVELLPSCP